MVGAIIGDIVGSRFEFRNHLSRDFELFTPECRFTDDTVMTCAAADALLRCKETGDWSGLSRETVTSMQTIGRNYPLCGYGRRFTQWIFSDNPRPYSSLGNGSAMRISPVGFIAESAEEVRTLSAAVTAVSHNHPEGLKGAECTAMCIWLARQNRSREEIRHYVEAHYYPLDMTCADYRAEIPGMRGKETCPVSVPQALVCFLESTDFEDCIRRCISTGGDSDTVAAIAGGIAEAYYGFPEALWTEAERFLDDQLLEIIARFRQRKSENSPESYPF